MENKPITVTSPLLPDLDEFIPYLKQIWDSKWITNNGDVTVMGLCSIVLLLFYEHF